MNDFEYYLKIRLAKQNEVIELNELSPDDIKQDKIWLLTQSYNIGIQHAIRIITDEYLAFLAQEKAKEQQTETKPEESN